MVRLRKKPHQIPTTKPQASAEMPPAGASDELHLGGGAGGTWSTRAQWIFFAMASGACAAFNGVFAKL